MSFKKVRVDTKSLDGLRGLAALHVAIGHCLKFSHKPTHGTDLSGGCAIATFFIISGMVMVLGYGQRPYDDGEFANGENTFGGGTIYGNCGHYLCWPFDYLHVWDLGVSNTTNTDNREVTASPLAQSDHEESHSNDVGTKNSVAMTMTADTISFPYQDFFWKRVARLAPMYYITTWMAIPLWFLIDSKTTYFVYKLVVSLFAVSSWVLQYPINGPLWTISTMAFFYICFPWLIIRFQRHKINQSLPRLRSIAWWMYILQISLALLFLVIVLLAYGNPTAWYLPWKFFPPCRIPVFIMGMCLGLIRIMSNIDQGEIPPLLMPKHDAITPALVYSSAVVTGLLLSKLAGPDWAHVNRIVDEPLIPIVLWDWLLELSRSKNLTSSSHVPVGVDVERNGAVGTSSTTMTKPIDQLQSESYSSIERFLRCDTMQLMGKISMSFYMVHWEVLKYTGITCYHLRHHNESNVLSQQEYAYPPAWMVPFVLGLSLLLGYFLTFYVELPLHKWVINNFNTASPSLPVEGHETSQASQASVSQKTNIDHPGNERSNQALEINPNTLDKPLLP